MNNIKSINNISMLESVVRLRQEMTGSYYNTNDILRLYQFTNVYHNFVYDNIAKCDTGTTNINSLNYDNIMIKSQKRLYRQR